VYWRPESGAPDSEYRCVGMDGRKMQRVMIGLLCFIGLAVFLLTIRVEALAAEVEALCNEQVMASPPADRVDSDGVEFMEADLPDMMPADASLELGLAILDYRTARKRHADGVDGDMGPIRNAGDVFTRFIVSPASEHIEWIWFDDDGYLCGEPCPPGPTYRAEWRPE